MFFAECEPLKLRPALRKCLTFSRTPESAVSAAEALSFQHRPEGVVVVGTPTGSDAFVREHADSKAANAHELVGTMMDLRSQRRTTCCCSACHSRASHGPLSSSCLTTP